MKILGFTEEINNCDCCGKSELKGTVAINFDGDIKYFGRTCATKQGALKNEIEKAVKSNESVIKFVNAFILRNKISNDRQAEILQFAKNNKGQSLNIFI